LAMMDHMINLLHKKLLMNDDIITTLKK